MSNQNGHSLRKMQSESIIGIIRCKFKRSVSAPKGRLSSTALKLFWPFVGPFCQMGFYIDPNKNHFCPTKHQFNRCTFNLLPVSSSMFALPVRYKTKTLQMIASCSSGNWMPFGRQTKIMKCPYRYAVLGSQTLIDLWKIHLSEQTLLFIVNHAATFQYNTFRYKENLFLRHFIYNFLSFNYSWISSGL